MPTSKKMNGVVLKRLNDVVSRMSNRCQTRSSNRRVSSSLNLQVTNRSSTWWKDCVSCSASSDVLGNSSCGLSRDLSSNLVVVVKGGR